MKNENMDKLVEILEEAQHNHERAGNYFEDYANETDEEMARIYWTRSEEYSGKCQGLLDAYEILTGRHVLAHNILWELSNPKLA